MARDLGLAAAVVLVVSIWLGLCTRVAIGQEWPFPIPQPEAPTVVYVREPPSVCGSPGYQIRLAQPMEAAMQAPVTSLTVRCGEWLDESGPVPHLKPCARVEAYNQGEIERSVTVGLASAEDCQPVPEPTVRVGLMLGLLGLAAMARRR